MPVMHFQVRWPDDSQSNCYSPSLVVKDFLEVNQSYTIEEFLNLTSQALNIASERVREKYGFACSQAMDQLAQIEAKAAEFPLPNESQVTVLSYTE
jgi:uncharacterized repeat protein (TIGR04042 family)